MTNDVAPRCPRVRRLAWVVSAILALDLIGLGAVHATGYFINQESASGLGRADAGDAAAAADASTVFYNPAGMTELWQHGADTTRNTLIQGGAHLIIPLSHLTNDGSTAATPFTLGAPVSYPGGGSINPGHISPIPNFYVVRRLFDGAAFAGLGVTAPFGLSSQYSSQWFGRYDALRASLLTVDISPVVAIPINPYVSIGGGLDIEYQRSILASALPNPLAPGGPSTATDGRFDIHGNAWAVGFNLGVLVKPTENLRLGLHYRSAVDHTLEGRAAVSAFTGPLASVLNFSSHAKAVSKLPDILTTGIVYRVSNAVTLFGEASYYGWSRVGSASIQFANGAPDQTLVQRYRDTFALGVGAEYRWSDTLTLRTGFKFDRTPTVDQFRNTSFPDSNRYWLTVGATQKLSPATTVDVALQHVLEDGTQVDLTRAVYAGTPLASAVNVRAKVNSTVTTLSAAINYRF